MPKIDVIIPTIMSTDPDVFGWTLAQCQTSPVVGKIIVIDNTGGQFHDRLGALEGFMHKLEVHDGEAHGFYVNDAWNFGIQESDAEYYLLLNDDILMDRHVLETAVDQMEKHKDIALLTVATQNNVNIDNYEKIDHRGASPDLSPKLPNNRQGWLMIGRKKQWEPIPEGLKLFYGDDWIYHKAKKKGQIRILSKCVVSHFQSSSVNKNIGRLRPIIKEDEKCWAELYKKGKI